jgi:hypothetical protein
MPSYYLIQKEGETAIRLTPLDGTPDNMRYRLHLTFLLDLRSSPTVMYLLLSLRNRNLSGPSDRYIKG